MQLGFEKELRLMLSIALFWYNLKLLLLEYT